MNDNDEIQEGLEGYNNVNPSTIKFGPDTPPVQTVWDKMTKGVPQDPRQRNFKLEKVAKKNPEVKKAIDSPKSGFDKVIEEATEDRYRNIYAKDPTGFALASYDGEDFKANIEGLAGLSDEEYRQWKEDNWEVVKDMTFAEKEEYYYNQQYEALVEFQKEAYKNGLISNKEILHPAELVDSKYKKDAYNNYILDGVAKESGKLDSPEAEAAYKNLTLEGKLEFLNSNYISFSKMSRELENYVNENVIPKELSPWQKFTTKYSPAQLVWASDDDLLANYRKNNVSVVADKLNEYNNQILEEIEAKDSKRKEKDYSREIHSYKDLYTEKYRNNELSSDDIDAKFEEIGKYSPYYLAFKDSNEFDSYDTEEKINALSKYQAISEAMGEEAAVSALNVDMRNWVDEHQGRWEQAWNSTIGFSAEFAGLLMGTVTSSIALYKQLFQDEEALKNYLNGTAPGYGILLDPSYWEDVRQYNAFDPAKIREIKNKYGGISPNVNVTKAGEELKFFSWDTLGQVFEQSGQFVGMVTTGWAFGGTSSLLTKWLPPRLSAGLSAAVTTAFTTASAAFSEGYSTYSEAKGLGEEQIQKTIDSEIEAKLRDYYNSDEFKYSLLAAEIEQKEKEEKERSGENIESGFSTTYFIDDEARRNYLGNQLLRAKYENIKNEVENKYEEAKKQAEKEALTAFRTTTTLNAAKTAITNAGFRKWLYDKGTRNTLNMRGPKVKGTYSNNKANAEVGTFGHYVKPVLKNPLVEYGDEYLDGVINTYGKSLALNDLNDYMINKYNPDAYLAASNYWLTDITRAWNSTSRHLLDRELMYEAWLGALSGGFNATPRLKGIYNRLRHGTYLTSEERKLNEIIAADPKLSEEEKLNLMLTDDKLTSFEKLNRLVNNGIISDISDIDENLREATRTSYTVGKAITENIDNVMSMIGLVNAEAQEENAKGNTLIEAVDAKTNTAFNLAAMMEDSKESLQESNTDLDVYNDLDKELTSIANGNVSDNDIVKFKVNPANKAFIKENNPTDEEIKKKIIENAKSFQEYRNLYKSITKEVSKKFGHTISKDYRNQVAFILFRKKDWENRLKTLEEETSTSNTAKPSITAVGNSRAIEARIETLKQLNNDLVDEIQETKEKLKNEKDKGSKQLLTTTIKAKESKLSDIKDELKTLRKATDEEVVLSEEEIMALNHSDRAAMLNDKNINNYNAEQRKVIKNLINSKTEEELDKIQDMATLSKRIQEANNTYNIISENPKSLDTYLKAIQGISLVESIRSYNNRIYIDFKHDMINIPKTEDKVSYIHNNLVSSDMLKLFLEDYSEYSEELGYLINLLETKESLLSLIRSNKELTENESNILKNIIEYHVRQATTPEDFITSLDQYLLANIDTNSDLIRKFHNILSEQEDFKALRDSTIVNKINKKAKRQERKKEKEEKKKKKEEEKKNSKPEESTTQETPSAESTSTTVNSITDINIEEETVEDKPKVAEQSQPLEISLEDIDISEGIEMQEQVDLALSNNPDSKIDTQEIPKPDVEVSSENQEDSDALLGNAIFRYDSESIKDNEKKSREGKEEDDKMSRFFRWMDSAGITYQETIDLYLSDISKTNPDVKFLLVNPVDNSTKDKDMQDMILTVVEYDSKVARIYKNPGNNVIDSNDKKYLVIGNLGFSRSQQPRFAELSIALKSNSKEYFQSNPSERFYVDDTYKTKIKSIDRGHVIHKQDQSSEKSNKRISELTSDQKSNPRNTSLADLKWGIVRNGRFTIINGDDLTINSPQDLRNYDGRVYLLLKSSDGSYTPILVHRKTLNEINEGALKNSIISNIENLTSMNPKVQEKAFRELRDSIYLSKYTNIKVTPTGEIAITINNITTTFDPKSPNFNKEAFFNKIKDLDPYINITVSTLLDENTLMMYDEAGTLEVTLDQLYTSNAGYSIYAVDTTTGEPIINNSSESTTETSRSIGNTSLPEVYYKGHKYVKDGRDYTLNGKVVTDANIIQQLDWISLINSTNPSYVEGNTEYYILDNNSDNPVVIKYNTISKTPTQCKKSWAKQIIEKANSTRLKENATKTLERENKVEEVQKSVNEDTSPSGIEFLDIIEGNAPAESKKEESSQKIEVTVSSDEHNETMTNSISIQSIFYSTEFGDRFEEILESKGWNDIPEDITLWDTYFANKGIDVLNITNAEVFLNMLEECK